MHLKKVAMEQDQKVPKDVEKLVKIIGKLEPQEFIGVCKILGIQVYNIEEGEEENEEPHVEVRPAEILLSEVFDKLISLSRIQRRNLKKLLKLAVKGR